MLNRNQSKPQQSFGSGFFSGLLTGVFLSTLFFVLVVGLVVIALPATGWSMPEENTADSITEKDRKTEPRPIGDIRRDMEAFIKRSKNGDDPDEKAAAAVELCILHHQIVTDSRFGQSDRLASFRAITATRLKKIKKEIELALKRQARADKKSKRSKHNEASESHQQELLASSGSREMSFETYHEIVAGEFESMSQFTGGPIRIWSYAGGTQCDYGEDLVELITNTINPDFWKSNGGEGVIEYYQPLRIIVVGGTTQVHGDITDLLRLMRRMSR